MTLAKIEISLSLGNHMAAVLAQRGGSCSIVLTENMFSSSCIIQPLDCCFFLSLAAQVQEHVFAFNRLGVLCVALLVGSSFDI